MVAQAVRRCGLSLALGAVALSVAAQDASFLDGAALARQLSHNLVVLAAEDIGEHGFGLVVFSQAIWFIVAGILLLRSKEALSWPLTSESAPGAA